MVRFLFLSILLFSANVYAGDVLYYVCLGEDREYQVAALQQVSENDNGSITATFKLDSASETDEFMTRYNQKGELVFKSISLGDNDAIVIGDFERDGKDIGMKIFTGGPTGYRMELTVDSRNIDLRCKYKL